jgi:hypothetical protein
VIYNPLQRCGEELYADFKECHSATAVEFAKDAAGPSNAHSVVLSSSSDSSESSSLASVQSQSSQSTFDSETPPSTGNQEVLSVQTPPDIPPGTPIFLLLCINNDMHNIVLKQPNITYVGNDQTLIYKIKEIYKNACGVRAKMNFIVPKTIEFVRVSTQNQEPFGSS